jgi:hypothetical protein
LQEIEVPGVPGVLLPHPPLQQHNRFSPFEETSE